MDPKNRAWSYHNGGNWPSLVWLLAAACVCTGAFDILQRALDDLGSRLARDNWPEYYDGQYGRLVGREARVLQTWSIAGFLVAEHLAEHPQSLERIGFASSGSHTVTGKCQVPA
jgi:glycogen debranching enzyme